MAGASGLVGRELLQLLLASPEYGLVHSLLRRAGAGVSSAKLRELVVSFDDLPALPPCDDVFIALGTTIKVAGSEAAFRRVDYDYVVAVAAAGRRAGATRLGIVSALGADAQSRVFYNRVKGEMEQAVSGLGYESVVIAQPSLLMGDREALGQPTRAGEVWARRLLAPIAGLIPASFRPVNARDVAAALLAAMLRSAPGTTVIRSRDMH
ncbi:MAG TPA: oxidoreductase [Polyangiaceae bacterium]|nr:oxidoreductase [Polyangiaceae bacterium]